MNHRPTVVPKKRQTSAVHLSNRAADIPPWAHHCISSPQEGVRGFLNELCRIAEARYSHIRVLSRSGQFYKLAESVGPYIKIGWQRRNYLLDKKDGKSAFYQFNDYRKSTDCAALKNKQIPGSFEWEYLNSLVYGYMIPLKIKDIELGYVTLSWDREDFDRTKVEDVRKYVETHAEYIPLVYQASRNLIADNFLSELWSDSAGILSATNEYDCYKRIAIACMKLWGNDVTVFIGKLSENKTHVEFVTIEGKRGTEAKKRNLFRKRFPLSRDAFGWLLESKDPLLSYSTQIDKRFRNPVLKGNANNQGSAIGTKICSASGNETIALIKIEHDLPYYFDHDDLRYISGISRIGYENIKAHQEVRNKTSRDFAALFTGVAHDVIEPLQAIVADAEILKYEASNALTYLYKTVDIEKYLNDTFRRSTNFLEEAFNMHKRMMSYLDKEGEDRPNQITTGVVRIYQMLNALTDQWEQKAENQGVEIRKFYDSLREAKVICDETELKSSLVHLLGNAIKYSYWGKMKKEDGEKKFGRYIKIKGRLQGEYIVIEIENYGIGILGEEINLVKQQFYRGKLAVKEGKTGTGRGLWSVDNFLKGINGEMKIRSLPMTDEIDGPYTNTFSIYLPAYKSKEKNNG